MELLIPYKWTAIDITTHPNGDLRFILPNDTELQQHFINQLMEWISYDEFIQAIGTEEFDKMIEFYNSQNNKGNK